MPNSITNRQLFFILFVTLTTYTVVTIPRIMAENADTGGWIPIFIATLVFAIAVTIIVSLQNMFQGSMLFDYSQKIIGKFFAYVISIFFLLYFLTIGVFLTVSLFSVLKAEFFFETPEWAILFISVPVIGYIACKGITNVARFLEIIGILFIIAALVVHFLMLTQGNRYSILPLFQASKIYDYIAATKHTILPFLGIEVLTIIPFTKENGKKAKKVAFFSVVFIGLYYVLTVESSIMILGKNNIMNYKYALIEAVELVDIPLLERADLLYLNIGFMGLIGGVCVVYLAIVEYACRLFAKAKRVLVVSVVGIIIIALSLLTQYIDQSEQFFLATIPIAGVFAAIVIPIVLLLIAKVKKRASENH